MNTKNFAICLIGKKKAFIEGRTYDISSVYGNFSDDINVYVENEETTLACKLNDSNFCFIFNATQELEAKLKGGAA